MSEAQTLAIVVSAICLAGALAVYSRAAYKRADAAPSDTAPAKPAVLSKSEREQIVAELIAQEEEETSGRRDRDRRRVQSQGQKEWQRGSQKETARASVPVPVPRGLPVSVLATEEVEKEGVDDDEETQFVVGERDASDQNTDESVSSPSTARSRKNKKNKKKIAIPLNELESSPAPQVPLMSSPLIHVSKIVSTRSTGTVTIPVTTSSTATTTHTSPNTPSPVTVAEIESLKAQLVTATSTTATQKQDLESLRAALETMTSNMVALQARHDTVNNTNRALASYAQDATAKHDTLAKAHDKVKAELEKARASAAAPVAAATAVVAAAALPAAKLVTKVNGVPTASASLQATQKELAGLRERLEAQTAEVARLNALIQALRDEAAELRNVARENEDMKQHVYAKALADVRTEADALHVELARVKEEAVVHVNGKENEALEELKMAHRKEVEEMQITQFKKTKDSEGIYLMNLEALKNTHKTEIEKLTKQIDEIQIAKFKSSKDSEGIYLMNIEALKSNHKSDLEKIQSVHKKQLDDLRAWHLKSTKDTEAVHWNSIRALNSTHTADLEALKAACAQQLTTLHTLQGASTADGEELATLRAQIMEKERVVGCVKDHLASMEETVEKLKKAAATSATTKSISAPPATLSAPVPQATFDSIAVYEAFAAQTAITARLTCALEDARIGGAPATLPRKSIVAQQDPSAPRPGSPVGELVGYFEVIAKNAVAPEPIALVKNRSTESLFVAQLQGRIKALEVELAKVKAEEAVSAAKLKGAEAAARKADIPPIPAVMLTAVAKMEAPKAKVLSVHPVEETKSVSCNGAFSQHDMTAGLVAAHLALAAKAETVHVAKAVKISPAPIKVYVSKPVFTTTKPMVGRVSKLVAVPVYVPKPVFVAATKKGVYMSPTKPSAAVVAFEVANGLKASKVQQWNELQAGKLSVTKFVVETKECKPAPASVTEGVYGMWKLPAEVIAFEVAAASRTARTIHAFDIQDSYLSRTAKEEDATKQPDFFYETRAVAMQFASSSLIASEIPAPSPPDFLAEAKAAAAQFAASNPIATEVTAAVSSFKVAHAVVASEVEAAMRYALGQQGVHVENLQLCRAAAWPRMNAVKPVDSLSVPVSGGMYKVQPINQQTATLPVKSGAMYEVKPYSSSRASAETPASVPQMPYSFIDSKPSAAVIEYEVADGAKWMRYPL